MSLLRTQASCGAWLIMDKPFKSLKGKLLIDSGNLAGSFFSRTVVLLCQHSTEGAFGLTLNRSTEKTVGEMIIEEAFGVAVNNLLAEREVTNMLVAKPEHKKMDKAHEIATYVEFNTNQFASFQENVTAFNPPVAA